MRTTVKTCFKCGIEKPITDFYVHPQMSDGRLNKCKACTREDVRRNYESNVEHYRAYDKERGFRAYDLQKIRVRRAVRDALASGALAKGLCEVGRGCAGRIEAHHDDYKKPLVVRWLCKCHHAEIHTVEEVA